MKHTYKLNVVFLNFVNAETEKAYEKSAFKHDKLSFKILATAALIVNVAVFFVDWSRTNDFLGTLLVRGSSIVALLLGLLLIFPIKQNHPNRLQLVIFLDILLIIFCYFIGMSLVPLPDYSLPNTVATCIFFSIAISGIRYRYALIYLFIVYFSYIALFTFFVQNEFWASQIIDITVNSLIGITAAYIIEKVRRKNFTKNQIVADQKEQLESINDIKNKLLSILSHDLRGPINKLISIVELFKRQQLTKDEFEEFIKKMGFELKNTSSFMENILYWSKHMFAGQELAATEIDIKEIVNQNLDAFENEISSKNIDIKNGIKESAIINSDRDTLDMTLRNLISNAIKFTPENGGIEIGLNQKGDFVELYISDSGQGIESGRIPELFSLKTVSTEGTNGEKGTGLGLYLLKEFLEKKGGKISCETALGKGSTFYVTLPKNSPTIH